MPNKVSPLHSRILCALPCAQAYRLCLPWPARPMARRQPRRWPSASPPRFAPASRASPSSWFRVFSSATLRLVAARDIVQRVARRHGVAAGGRGVGAAGHGIAGHGRRGRVSTALTRRVLPPLASAAAVCKRGPVRWPLWPSAVLASLSALTRTTAGLLSAVAGLSAWARRSTAAPAPALAVSSGDVVSGVVSTSVFSAAGAGLVRLL